LFYFAWAQRAPFIIVINHYQQFSHDYSPAEIRGIQNGPALQFPLFIIGNPPNGKPGNLYQNCIH